MMGKGKEFIAELQLLLKKYDAEITADDFWEGYPEHGQDVRIVIEFDDFDVTDIDIGSWIDKDKVIS